MSTDDLLHRLFGAWAVIVLTMTVGFMLYSLTDPRIDNKDAFGVLGLIVGAAISYVSRGKPQ